jgi:hypothetical protein
MAMAFETVRYDVADTGVATIALDQPETRNALSDQVLDDLLPAFGATRDARRRGGALRRVDEHPGDGVQQRRQPGRLRRRSAAGAQALGDGSVPAVVPADRRAGQADDLRGHWPHAGGRSGAGAGVRPDRRARGRDVRDAGDQRRGVPVHDHGAIYRNVGRKKTNELLLLEHVEAREAERIGIVNRAVAAEDFNAAVREWAVKLAAKSPVLIRLGKDAMYRQRDLAFEDALEFLHHNLTLALSTEDIQEGVKAFFERREPQWKGQ